MTSKNFFMKPNLTERYLNCIKGVYRGVRIYRLLRKPEDAQSSRLEVRGWRFRAKRKNDTNCESIYFEV
jgi:hypothetical protein